VHIPNVKRTKLDSRSSKCVLFGVSEKTKGYRMYNPITKKIVISRDVIFKENKVWDWTEDDINVLLKWRDDEIDVAEEFEAEIEEQDQVQFEEQE
jgi:hypothetical protein